MHIQGLYTGTGFHKKINKFWHKSQRDWQKLFSTEVEKKLYCTVKKVDKKIVTFVRETLAE